MLTKSGHFKTTYLPCLVNVVCERPLTFQDLKAEIYNNTVISHLALVDLAKLVGQFYYSKIKK